MKTSKYVPHYKNYWVAEKGIEKWFNNFPEPLEIDKQMLCSSKAKKRNVFCECNNGVAIVQDVAPKFEVREAEYVAICDAVIFQKQQGDNARKRKNRLKLKPADSNPPYVPEDVEEKNV